MDQLLLQAVAAEAARRLTGQELLRAVFLGHHRYLLRFANAARDNLLISVRPDLSRFHLTLRSARFREIPNDRFAHRLDRELGGAVLTELSVRPWDRVVELRFRLPRRDDGATERRLIVELLGRSANLLVLDESAAVLAHVRDLRSAFRAPRAGIPYEPPAPREGYRSLPSGTATLQEIRSRWNDQARFLEPLSPILAADLRAAAGRDGAVTATARLQEVLDAVGSGSWRPMIYSRRPLDQLVEGERLEPSQMLLSPLPLLVPDAQFSESGRIPYDSPSEAAQVFYDIVERLRDFRALVDHHRAQVRREAGRLTTLIGKLERELDAARGADRYRRSGEALLAGFSMARVEADRCTVPDPESVEGACLTIPIDPTRSLQRNAEKMFARYKKLKRATGTIEARLGAARERLSAWGEIAQGAERVSSPEDLDALRDSMGRLGLVHAGRRKKTGPLPQKNDPIARVRQHTGPDGLVIMVGKSGAENDTLTFRVAAPWDFWLHAAGFPGAHVVVRNPQRLKTMPSPTLQRAAEIAAYYSGARTDGAVEVHYTQRKHVHKRKGTPPGQVLVRRFRSIRVAPRLPAPSYQDV